MDNALKRVIRISITTPTEIISAETGTWNIENQMAKKQLMYYHKIKTSTDKGNQIYTTATDPKIPWKIQVENTMKATNISEKEILPDRNPKPKGL